MPTECIWEKRICRSRSTENIRKRIHHRRHANTFDDVKMHYEAGADYIGCGPFRFTTTKKDLSPVLGLEGYRSIIQQMKEADIHLPIVAIGGITLEDIPSIMETGITALL